MKRSWMIVGAAVAATAGLAVAMAHGQDHVTSPGTEPPSTLRVDYPLPDQLAAFRRPQVTQDAVPGNLAQGLVLDDGTADVAKSRRGSRRDEP